MSDPMTIGTISIARHGRPALDRSMTLDWRGYQDWWAAYDAGGLAEGQTPPDALIAAAERADVILCSTLRRAVETADRVAGARAVIQDPVFVEAPLPPPPVPGLKLKPKTWGGVARMSWYFGLSRGAETRRQAEKRAHDAVDRLETEALAGREVLLCAHGWFNRMMRPVLLARGWRCEADGGDVFWGVRQYRQAR